MYFGCAMLLHKVHPYFPLIYPSFISKSFPMVSHGSVRLNSEWAQTQLSLAAAREHLLTLQAILMCSEAGEVLMHFLVAASDCTGDRRLVHAFVCWKQLLSFCISLLFFSCFLSSLWLICLMILINLCLWIYVKKYEILIIDCAMEIKFQH